MITTVEGPPASFPKLVNFYLAHALPHALFVPPRHYRRLTGQREFAPQNTDETYASKSYVIKGLFYLSLQQIATLAKKT